MQKSASSCFGRCGVQLFESRHAFLGELEFRLTPDHAHQLIRRGALHLLAQHAHRNDKRQWAYGAFPQVPGETEFIPLPER